MWKKKIDLVGQKFQRLTVIEDTNRRNNGNVIYRCECICKKETFVTSQSLRSGKRKSCGCLAKEKIGKLNRTHGESNTRLHGIWKGIKKRCKNKNTKNFKNYGGRGITVCEEWSKSYVTFREWALKNGYHESLEIDRINNNGNYEPSNCRWVTRKENNNNRRNSRLLTINGETKRLREWCDLNKISCNTVRKRLNNGWSVEHPLLFSKRTATKITVDNETRTVEEWAALKKITVVSIYDRLKKGWPVDATLFQKSRQPVNLTIDGDTKKLVEWCHIAKIPYTTAVSRLKAGKSPEEILLPWVK